MRSGKIDFKDLIYTTLIKTIKIDQVTEIAFSYSDRFSSFYGDSNTDDKVKGLNSIVCKYNGDVIHNVSFEYLDKGKYSFLQKVKKIAQHETTSSKEEVHEFSYYFNREVPSPKTISLNHWGGWSGGYDTNANVNDFLFNLGRNKAVNTEVCDFGLLQKVTYPSGGYTEVEYEYNRYNRWIEKDLNNWSLNERSSANHQLCSGARIKTIKDYDPAQQQYTNVRTFEYKNPITNEGSGMISFEHEYVYNEQIRTQYEENVRYSNLNDTIKQSFSFIIKVVDDCSY